MEVIKFSAEWCGPCKAYKSIFDTVLLEYSDIAVIEADVDKDADIILKYGIVSVPTTIITKNNVELGRLKGIINPGELKSFLNKYINI
jgi:thioredoxin 1|tara:strand:+ start:89 stop:352 length:264 start_codon:yes stop_codon:yes gene_type:complete